MKRLICFDLVTILTGSYLFGGPWSDGLVKKLVYSDDRWLEQCISVIRRLVGRNVPKRSIVMGILWATSLCNARNRSVCRRNLILTVKDTGWRLLGIPFSGLHEIGFSRQTVWFHGRTVYCMLKRVALRPIEITIPEGIFGGDYERANEKDPHCLP